LDWFKNWFDSFYYHKLYRHRNTEEAREFIDNIINYIEPPAQSRVLDLACGKGRHSIYLNSKGYDVVGVDLSQNSIDIANQSANESLHFQQMDMRYLECSNPFHLVVNLFTSFGYFNHSSENLDVLNGVHHVLQPNGILVIDFLNATKVIQNLVPEEIQTIDGIQFVINRFVENNTVVKTISVTDNEQEHHFQERVSMFELSDFEDMLSQTGFKLLNHFGDYQLNQFKANASDRLIIIAQKQE
jgi:2-polyprenyl-3-methyl-5-hydroxy-6-metoxy-1,4-benzoquinol methylase